MSNEVIHSERGGLRYGLESVTDQVVWSYPLAKLTIDYDFLEINYPFRKRFVFKRNEVSFEYYNKYFCKGVRILHEKDNIPVVLVFGSSNALGLLDILKKWKNVGCDENHNKPES